MGRPLVAEAAAESGARGAAAAHDAGSGGMSAPVEQSVAVNGVPCRIWEKGSGSPVVYLAGLVGLPHWTPFLDRLAEHRRVIAPSLPGFPGAAGHDALDTLLDWIAA